MHKIFMAIACTFWVLSLGITQAYLMGLTGETGDTSSDVETALSAIFMSALAIYAKMR